MQRILDLLLNEVRVNVNTREKNRPDLQAKHGRYKARENTPGRLAYETERLGRSGEGRMPQGRGKPDITYAQYAAAIPPTINKRSVPTSELDRMSNRGVRTSKPVSQAARSAMGGKPTGFNQANIARAKFQINQRKQRQQVQDHTEYFDRLVSLLIENSAMKRKFRNAEIKVKKKELGQPLKQKGHSLDQGPPEGAKPAGRTEMNYDDYEPGTTERNQARDIAGKQAAAARR